MARVEPRTEPKDPRDLAAKYDRLAWRVAISNRHRLRPGSELDDLAQVCREAVVRAARAWDRRRGVAFMTYAWRSAFLAIDRFLVLERRRGLTATGDSSSKPAIRDRVICVFNQDHAAEMVGAGGRGRPPDFADLAPGREPEPGDRPAVPTGRFWENAVAGLNPRQSAALLARYRDGLKLAEIAGRMGLTKERVRQLCVEAVAAIREDGRLDEFRG